MYTKTMRDRILGSILVFTLMVVLGFFGVVARQQQVAIAQAPPQIAQGADVPELDACLPANAVCVTITVTASLPPVTVTKVLPHRTITLPGGTRTITVPPERARETVTIPGPAKTRTLREPGGVRTVVSRSTITIEREIRGTSRGETIRTISASARPGGQSTVTRRTMVTTPVPTVVTKSRTIPGTPITIETVKTVGLGILSAIAILALILGGMAYGFYEGRKVGLTDANEKNTTFLSTLREMIRRPQGKHR